MSHGYELQIHNVHHVVVAPLSELTSVGSAYRTIEVFSADNKRLFTLTLFSGVLDPDSDELLPQVRV